MGAKTRHAAEIIAITCANRKKDQPYVEPFVGGGNVICRVSPDQGLRIGADVNRYMIALLDAVGNRGWLPPETMSKEEWLHIKNNQDQYPDELVAFAATGPTFGSNWMDQFALQEAGNLETGDVKYKAARGAALRDAPGLRGVDFRCSSYDKLSLPPGALVYCDPPYSQTAMYAGAKTTVQIDEDLFKNTWNAIEFWRWANKMADAGHAVYVSEYSGPPLGVFNGLTPEIKTERDATAHSFRALQADQKSTREEREAAALMVRAVDQKVKAEAERLAARWQVLWEKEVISDFSSTRKAGVNSGKREVEKLFHRAP